MVPSGFKFAALPLLAGGVFLWRDGWLVGALLLGLGVFVLFFFRDPDRRVPEVAGAIVSPADGRVLGIDQVVLAGTPYTRVSIFLSLFDVHVNRAPIAGRIAAVQYRPGKFHVASRAAASRENENNEVTLEGEGTRVVLKQIAGLLARRIEFWKKLGDELERGERLGMIRFGSRVEVLFDSHYRVRVASGEHVRGGSSILAVQE
ncbi:MAG: phosphatidylserine decarboxylase family protein [Acidobacteria bacterium]|nr:phosphatidylserine decarboxylase family protein [Acidobacteriota bacterium]